MDKLENKDLAQIVAYFMKQHDLEKIAIMCKIDNNNNVDIDILGGCKDFKVNKGE